MLDKIIATFCILLICYEGACIGKARTDVVRLKVGVVAEYFLRRCALLQQRQYGLHLDAKPSYNGLAAEDVRVNHDTLQQGHSTSIPICP